MYCCGIKLGPGVGKYGCANCNGDNYVSAEVDNGNGATKMTIKEIIASLGGPAKMSRELGASPRTVSNWNNGKTVYVWLKKLLECYSQQGTLRGLERALQCEHEINSKDNRQFQACRWELLRIIKSELEVKG